MKSVCWSLLRLFVAGVSISAAAIQLFPQDNSKPLTPNVFSYGHDDIRVSSPLQQKKNLSALICLGGPPNYCSNSTQDPVQETPVRPPLVDTPFADPDFGSRMVRVTDANTLTNVDGQRDYFTGISYMTDASSEANEWSKFDPTIGTLGGYRFLVYTTGGWAVAFTLDATTMQVNRISGQANGILSLGGMLKVGGAFSYVDPDILYRVVHGQLEAFHFSTNSATPLYNFTACPGLPVYTEGYGGSLSGSADDTKFSLYFGGRAQGETTLVTYYDRSANNGTGACYWYDTATGTVGGTNMAPTAVAQGVGQLAPPAAPVVIPHPGSGNLPAGNYYVRITATTQMNPQDGETTPSPEVGPINLSAPGSLTITFPTHLSDPDEIMVPGGTWGCDASQGLGGSCKPFNVYIGTSPGGETLQNTEGPVGGTSYTQSSPLDLTSAQPPAVSTAGYNVHNARLSKDGTYVRIDAQQGYTLYFWKPGSNQVTTCTIYGDNCGGHQALGYTHLINDPNNHDISEVMIRPISDFSKYRELVNPLPTPHQWGDSHWSWNDADPSDSMPVCGSIDGAVGPYKRAYPGEIVCVATSGSPRVWRFAHHRATGKANSSPDSPSSFWATPRGNVSQDGKFYMFTSDWESSLGDQKGSYGCPESGNCRTDVFIVELH
jgi:hypothetical protein